MEYQEPISKLENAANKEASGYRRLSNCSALREELEIQKSECSDERLLEITRGTIVRCRVEVRIAWADLKAAIWNEMPKWVRKFLLPNDPSEQPADVKTLPKEPTL